MATEKKGVSLEQQDEESHPMAPTMNIETVSVVRPIKIVALLCGVIAILLDGLTIGSTAWMSSGYERHGLWELCQFNDTGRVSCWMYPTEDWLHACRALCLVCLVATIVAVVLVAVGLCTLLINRKYKCYDAGMILFLVAVVLEIIALVVFPVKYIEGLPEGWGYDFGWAYGLSWGVTIFLVAAAILLFCDRGAEELMYLEKERFYDNDTIEEKKPIGRPSTADTVVETPEVSEISTPYDEEELS